MKRFLTIIAVIGFVIACNAQPKSDYVISSNSVNNAVKYHFFLEKNSTSPSLTQDMDYLNPDVTALEVGTSTTPSFTVNVTNDGSEYVVGVVAEDSAGFYSGMGVNTGTVGTSPSTPGGVTFKKK